MPVLKLHNNERQNQSSRCASWQAILRQLCYTSSKTVTIYRYSCHIRVWHCTAQKSQSACYWSHDVCTAASNIKGRLHQKRHYQWRTYRTTNAAIKQVGLLQQSFMQVFFAAIAVACAVTKSGWCLLALFATPSIKIGGDSAK